MKYIKENIWMVAVLIAVISFGLIRSIYISEADVMWQIRSGQDLLKTGIFVQPDGYSWTASGKEYISNSWLWNVIVAVIYQATGFNGIAFFTAFLTSSTLALLVYAMKRSQISWFSILIFISMMGILSGVWLSGRPQICDYFLLAVAIAFLSKINLSKVQGHLLTFGFFAGLLILWSNLHLTGLVGAVCLAALYFLKQTNGTPIFSKQVLAPVLRTIGLLLVLLTSCFLTPYGWDGFVKPLITVTSSVGIISEWMSPWTLTMYANTISAVAIFLVVAALVFFRKNLNPAEILLVLGLTGVASWQARWTPFMVIMLCLLFGKAIDAILAKSKIQNSVYAKTAAAALVFTILAFSVTSFIPHSRVDGAQYGFSLLDSIPQNCKIFNEPAMGGPIILMRHDLKVSLDGRNDLYGAEEYLVQNEVAYNKEYALDWFDKNNIECVLLHKDTDLNSSLAETPQWELKKEDEVGTTLWIRKS